MLESTLNINDHYHLQQQHQRQAHRRHIVYWGIVTESDVYAKLLGTTYFPESNQSDYEKQMKRLFEKRVSTRLKDNLDEVLTFRIRFSFAKLGAKRSDFEAIVDKLVCARLCDASTSRDLKQLCASLKERIEKNQERLHYYMGELLKSKWPALKEKEDNVQFRLTELEFALAWNSFIDLETCQLTHKTSGWSLPLDDKWQKTVATTLSLFVQCVEEMVSGAATIQVIKLLHANLRAARELVEFVKNKGLAGRNFTFDQTKVTAFDALVMVRMRECREFERYRANLRVFVQICNNFK